MLHSALAVAAALVSAAFALCTFERWLGRRRRHELAWSVALAFFSIAAFALAAGASMGWDAVTFRIFYLFGAIVNVPFLALGTVYLLGGERRGDQVAVVVSLLCAFAAGVVLFSPLTGPIPAHELVRGSQVFGPAPRILAAVASGAGAMTIFAGAAWSAWRHRRGRLVAANALIALGTLVLSASGLLNSVLGEMDAFAVTLVVGISVMFAGFLLATGGAPAPRPRGPRPPRALAASSEEPGATASRPARAAARG
ncbi:MAG: hypothetical protein KY454_05405 [Actinobacteria bacterium]|nr:hypothetical protein [Actinomycetota bacterium]MBW3649010.1 hypothetical protein [Actinomycetota bacterium]